MLSQAQPQREAIERVTGMHVEPLLVFSRAWVDRPLARRKGVRVLPARMLLGYLTPRSSRPSRSAAQRALRRAGDAGGVEASMASTPDGAARRTTR